MPTARLLPKQTANRLFAAALITLFVCLGAYWLYTKSLSDSALSNVTNTATDLSSAVDPPPPEIVILNGVEEIERYLKAEDWWGDWSETEMVQVPRIVLISFSANWRETSNALTVSQKKEFFYRLTVPMIMHANDMVRTYRHTISEMKEQISQGRVPAAADLEWFHELALTLRLIDAPTDMMTGIEDKAATLALFDKALFHLDVVPTGLAVAQAAYESGYGTSRFAIEGNALFGQWTFDDSGMTPNRARAELGSYGVASFDWPFDSVRSYIINLSRHPAYEKFRQLRAEAREKGLEPDSMTLAEGLLNYSERGQIYVDTLKDIIRTNHLEVFDAAVLKNQPLTLLIGAGSEAEAQSTASQIAELRQSQQLTLLVEQMALQ